MQNDVFYVRQQDCQAGVRKCWNLSPTNGWKCNRNFQSINQSINQFNTFVRILNCHVFVRFSSPGMGTFIKKIKGPQGKKTPYGRVAQKWGAKAPPAPPHARSLYSRSSWLFVHPVTLPTHPFYGVSSKAPCCGGVNKLSFAWSSISLAPIEQSSRE